jgi:8-hydroxy-5-deazaflavin:NADPH oxidoreductase
MKIAVLGTGMVGQALGTKLLELGHEVRMGSRTKDNEKAIEWTKQNPERASQGDFKEAAAFGDLIINANHGDGAIDALTQAGVENLNEKVLIDVSNPLVFTPDTPPSLFVCNTDSLGERIQKAFPQVKVVKSLNTVSAQIMVNPGLLPEDSNIFLCGNDEKAKDEAKKLLIDFGWKNINDLGDITGSRAMEMYLILWIRLMGQFQSPNFNIKIVK